MCMYAYTDTLSQSIWLIQKDTMCIYKGNRQTKKLIVNMYYLILIIIHFWNGTSVLDTFSTVDIYSAIAQNYVCNAFLLERFWIIFSVFCSYFLQFAFCVCMHLHRFSSNIFYLHPFFIFMQEIQWVWLLCNFSLYSYYMYVYPACKYFLKKEKKCCCVLNYT